MHKNSSSVACKASQPVVGPDFEILTGGRSGPPMESAARAAWPSSSPYRGQTDVKLITLCRLDP